jgi:hypothetical protein
MIGTLGYRFLAMEPLSLEQSHVCPVCGSPNIKPFPRQNLTLIDDHRDLLASVLGYRCENGHVSIAAGLHL